MPRIVTIFNQEISVPAWQHCNDQASEGTRGSYYCKFLKGEKNERSCRLFEKSLFASYEWVNKCDECLEKSKLD